MLVLHSLSMNQLKTTETKPEIKRLALMLYVYIQVLNSVPRLKASYPDSGVFTSSPSPYKYYDPTSEI